MDHLRARTLQIDVWLDLICPWCWIGKSLLGQARRRLAESDPEVQVQTRWRSVQLIPQVPPEGWPYKVFYERRLGGPQAVRARQAQVLAAARPAGVAIDFSRITTFPNTAAAHRLLAQGIAQLAPADAEALLDRLFEAYFVRGEDLGDAATLGAIAVAHGVAPVADGLHASGPEPAAAVSGVPFFVFNGGLALSGAQPANVLWEAMRRAVAGADVVAS